MLIRVLVLLFVGGLGACANRTEEAKELLKARVGEKLYIEFQGVEDFPGGVVCGEYRIMDPMRASKRYRRFVVWGETAEDRPSGQDWDIFCSEDPEAALLATLGIGPPGDPANHLPEIRRDLARIEAALQQYLADNYALPSTEQGLAALVSPAASAPIPPKFRPGGYLDSVPEDPWGHPYHYEREGLSGAVSPEYRLYTLGADAAPGGAGSNADVGRDQLKYLEHIGL